VRPRSQAGGNHGADSQTERGSFDGGQSFHNQVLELLMSDVRLAWLYSRDTGGGISPPVAKSRPLFG
jgi:hypothetical protein